MVDEVTDFGFVVGNLEIAGDFLELRTCSWKVFKAVQKTALECERKMVLTDSWIA